MPLARLLLAVPLAVAAGCEPVTVSVDAAPDVPFCDDYAEACGFDNDFGGMPYTDLGDCAERFEGYNTARADCVKENLSFAQEGDLATNCPRAAGADPCDVDDTFCIQYDLVCGFGNPIGGNSYADLQDCEDRFNAYSAERKACVREHLGFAEESSIEIHCPHVEGAAPCGP